MMFAGNISGNLVEKKVRDKSLKILQRWLSGKADISTKDMMKIWYAFADPIDCESASPTFS